MLRRVTLLAAIMFLSVTAIAVALPAMAQNTNSAAMATHPVIGLWRTAVSNTGDAPFTSLSTFHADGTYTEVLPDGLMLSGVWQPTGERTAIVTSYVNYFIDDRLVEGEGPLNVEVDESGNALTETGTFVGRFVDDGSIAIAVESPATGTRLGILPVEPLSAVVVPGMTESATPAP